MSLYTRITPPDQLTVNELIETSIARRAEQVVAFFIDYDHWNPEVDDGSCLQEREHELGIAPEEWAQYRADFEIAF